MYIYIYIYIFLTFNDVSDAVMQSGSGISMAIRGKKYDTIDSVECVLG